MPDEFSDYYHQYKHKVYSFVLYRVGGDVNLAEDLTSDVFLKAFERFESYNPKYAFSTWIFTIARNTVIDHYRKDKGQAADVNELAEVIGDERDTVEDWGFELDRQPKLKEIYRCLEKLPDFHKDCLILKYLEDHTNTEIAEITGQSESYVRQGLSRGLKKLKPLLQGMTTLLIIIISSVVIPAYAGIHFSDNGSRYAPQGSTTGMTMKN